MLSDWDAQLARFVKVMPHDYKRALTELAEEAEAGHEIEPAVTTGGEGFVAAEEAIPERRVA